MLKEHFTYGLLSRKSIPYCGLILGETWIN